MYSADIARIKANGAQEKRTRECRFPIMNLVCIMNQCR